MADDGEKDARVVWRSAALLSRLDPGHPPSGVHPQMWRRFLANCEIFLATWGDLARVLGWHPLTLFGVDKTNPSIGGLVWRLALSGGKIVEIDHGGAVIEAPSGALKVFIKPRAGADLTYPWQPERPQRLPRLPRRT
jgi:hypothetical protein